MIQTIATVIDSGSGWIQVQASSKSSCDHCQQPDCGGGQVNQALARRLHRLKLPYHQALPNGTQVLLSLPEQGLITAASLVFLLPLVTILLVSMLSNWLLPALGLNHELWTVALAIIAGWGGFALARICYQSLQKRQLFEPIVSRVLLNAELGCDISQQ